MSPAHAPAPLDGPTFADLGLPDALVAGLATRGIDHPFPIQASTIVDALDGRDVCGRAPTGSGKTLAFGIPLALRTGRARPGRPRSLVLVPTRELASQVTDEIRFLLDALPGRDGRRRVEAFYGGVNIDRQCRSLQRGVDVAVACPGRLADLIQRGACDLGDVEVVVLDEADRMSDMGFLPEVRRLLDQCRPARQTLLFSATLDGQVDVLIRHYQRQPVRHDHSPDEGADDRAVHLFWSVERPERVAVTAQLVDRTGPTVVFCRTKRGADRVARQIEAAGVRAAAIHGDRSQAQRERALEAFHRGQVQALVATDVAARGIHVDGVACVVHFDPPGDPKDYVHRSGRTARAGAAGTVISLVTGDQRADVKSLQKALGRPLGLTEADVAAVAQGRPTVPTAATPGSHREDGRVDSTRLSSPSKAASRPAHPRPGATAGAAEARRGAGRRRGRDDAGSVGAERRRSSSRGVTGPAGPAAGGPRGDVRRGERSTRRRSTTGTVSYFHRSKGFGFIAGDDGNDLFVHWTNIDGTGRRTLDRGQRVAFRVAPGKKGDEAHDVRAV